MSRYKLPASVEWERADYYMGHVIWLRPGPMGAWVAAVEGFRGGEEHTSGPRARERAIERARLRIDDMTLAYE